MLGITLLTSLDSLDANQIYAKSAKNTVLSLAELAKKSGLDGVVCSPLEAELLRNVCGKNFRIMTPGIRFDKAHSHDQKRIASPGLAISYGADHIVMGRGITGAENISSAIRRALAEMDSAEKNRVSPDLLMEQSLYGGTRESILKTIGVMYRRQE